MRTTEDETLCFLYKKLSDAQYLKRDFLKDIIETSNKETIQTTIDYIYSKSTCMFSPCQHLFAQIYKIDHDLVKLSTDNKHFDLSKLDESIELSNKISEQIKAYKKTGCKS